ncbi:MAG TPA: outer membrane beta-barrel protein [Phnomibacter sp.]|nr:outer membrane beta-barrel protein [Phnomibacter sp.]
MRTVTLPKLILSFCCLLFISAMGFAQNRIGSVKGMVLDTATKKAMPSATINVLDAKDSTLISFGRSKEDGSFELTKLNAGKFLLTVSYTGFSKVSKTFTISAENPVYDFSIIPMASNATLDEVVVTAAPVTIKGDTVEFNAASFKTAKPNAVVEDLLKKLPGVEVDKDGNIKANGQDVKRILVDGKQFFGNDPKMATKNLQADMVNKVQVFEKKSDKSEFTGFDDGAGEPTINLTLKQDKRQGIFGKATAGYGTDNRYAANANVNSFKKGEQVSLVGQANNTNNQNFTMSDFGGGGMQGGRGGGGGGQQGITATQTIGGNYNNFKNPKLDANASYFFNATQLDNDYDLHRESFVADTTQIYTELGKSGRDNTNHRVNGAIDWKFDSSNSIIVRPNFTYNTSKSSTGKNYNTLGESGSYLTDGSSITNNQSEGYNLGATALWRHKFEKAGRTFSTSVNFSRNQSTGDGNQNTVNTQYKGNAIVRSDTLNQVNNTETIANNYGVDISYTEPMSRRSLIEINGFYRFNDNTNDKKTYDYNKVTGEYDKQNVRLTNFFDNEYEYAGGGLAYKENRKGWNYTIGAKAQQAVLTSLVQGKADPITQKFFNVLPNAQVQIGTNRYRNTRIFYNGSVQNPSVTQLQPIEDISDPINVTKGNPDLKQSFTNNFRVNYNTFDPYTMKSFFLNVSARQTSNAIVNSDTLGIYGGRYTTYENVDGVYNLNANASIGLPVHIGETRANVNLTTGAGYSRNVNLLNYEENRISNTTISQRVSANYNYKELFDFSMGGSVAWTNAKYSLQAQQNTKYFTYNADAETNWFLPKSVTIGTSVVYTANTGRADGFNQNFALWNAYAAKSFLKNNRAEIRITANDILNQNSGISRTTTGNYVEDTRYSVVKRYFMLSFTYNLSKFGAQMGGGQRMMMMGAPMRN